jgi:hypothetical protein
MLSIFDRPLPDVMAILTIITMCLSASLWFVYRGWRQENRTLGAVQIGFGLILGLAGTAVWWAPLVP